MNTDDEFDEDAIRSGIKMICESVLSRRAPIEPEWLFRYDADAFARAPVSVLYDLYDACTLYARIYASRMIRSGTPTHIAHEISFAAAEKRAAEFSEAAYGSAGERCSGVNEDMFSVDLTSTSADEACAAYDAAEKMLGVAELMRAFSGLRRLSAECRAHETRLRGCCCVVERVRDAYIMPRLLSLHLRLSSENEKTY